jgi:serine/threonine protein phosphatase PrpC
MQTGDKPALVGADSAAMRIQSFGLSDLGQERKLNEDYFLVDPELGLYVVCDGMGGHAAGEIASSTAATTVHEHLLARAVDLAALDEGGPADRVEQILREALELASAKIYRMGQAEQGKKGMGTTCSALLVRGGKGVMAHVGDSRLYLVRKGSIHQISEDHTFLQEAVRHGIMTPEQAKQSTHRNIITRAVGPLEKVIVDTLVFDALDHDTFLLCSDGLHGYFEDDAELAGLLSAEALDGVPQRLIELANERGGSDNITAIVLRVEIPAAEKVEETERATMVNAGLDTLRHIQLFEELSMAELLRVSNACRTQEFGPGDVIIREGETSEALFLLVSGQVVVERSEHPVAILGAGSHFGEMALLSQRPRSATVKARSASVVLVLERPLFFAMLQQDSVLATKFLWRLAQSLSLRLDDFYDLQEVGASANKTTLRFGLYPSPFNYAPGSTTTTE